jgi:hypothetical protein
MTELQIRPRSSWGARPAGAGPGELDPRVVVGLAFHWPGEGRRTPYRREEITRALRDWQRFHMDGRGWSDIAYQVAVDQFGRVWRLRGLETQSAANGSPGVNARYGAVLLVLSEHGEQPSPAMLEAVRLVVAEHRRMFPRSEQLVGHGEIRPTPTACPGPAVNAALKAHQFDPNTGSEDDMTPQDRQLLEQIARDAAAAKDNSRRAVLRGQVNSRAIVENREVSQEIREQLEQLDRADAAAGQ